MTIHQFIQYMRYEQRSSSHTLIAYETDLTQFQNYLITQYDQNHLLEVKPEFIRSWIVQFMQKGVSSRTIHRKLASISRYFKYLQQKQLINYNPTEKIFPPKLPQRLPKFVKEQDMSRLFELLPLSEDYEGYRDKCILEVLYHTGIRRAELIHLTIDAIDFGKKILKVLGKRKKERMIPFSQVLAEGLETFLNVRNATFGESNTLPLFLTNKGKPLYPKLVYNIVHHYLGLVTTIDQKSPHIIRHSFATHLLNNGAELNAIKELLGHESLAATEVYTHNTLEQLREVYAKAHPKATH